MNVEAAIVDLLARRAPGVDGRSARGPIRLRLPD